MKILLTGGTGLIGQELGKELVRLGHSIVVITRSSTAQDFSFPCELVTFNLNTGSLLHPLLESVEAVVHLAGENVGTGRWSAAKKKAIYDSRIEGTKNLFASLQNSRNIRVFVSASATGFYGDQAENEITESSPAAADFLAKVTQDWEKVTTDNLQKNTRHVSLRIAMVIAPFGGAMNELIPLFKKGLGAPLGNGEQYMSWIHIDDVVALFCRAISDKKMEGTYNAVAPFPLRNSEFSKTLAEALGTHLLPSVPAFVLKTALSEKVALVLNSQKVIPAKLTELGLHFKFPTFAEAIKPIAEIHKGKDTVFYVEQFVPQQKAKVFAFFSAAENLEKITPPLLNFKITHKSTADIQEGALIDYRLKIHGVPVTWRTQILNWLPDERFVDTQLKGPYSKWHHTHSFYTLGNGTLMTDLVRYRVPLGALGKMSTSWLVKKDVSAIFEYRRSAVQGAFPETK